MVVRQPSKLDIRVRSPLPAPSGFVRLLLFEPGITPLSFYLFIMRLSRPSEQPSEDDVSLMTISYHTAHDLFSAASEEEVHSVTGQSKKKIVGMMNTLRITHVIDS